MRGVTRPHTTTPSEQFAPPFRQPALFRLRMFSLARTVVVQSDRCPRIRFTSRFNSMQRTIGGVHVTASVAGLVAVVMAIGCASLPQGSASSGASVGSDTVRLRPDDLASITAGFSATVQRDVQALRNATAAYRDVRVAQAAGYPTTVPACVADSTMGGMGRHYLDRAHFDETLDVRHPEMLIYAPDAGGRPDRLVGVEYAIPFPLLPATEKPPRLFGQEFRRHEEFKYWYLHVWAWSRNSAGLFSDWNPAIRC